MSKENEYKEIFLAEAVESHEELNRLITELEKRPDDKKSVDAIFRITHTLKGNASGMGFKTIADFAHVVEDIFSAIREKKLVLDDQIFSSLFKSIDVLGELIHAVKTGVNVQYRGIKTKLEVILNSLKDNKKTDTEDSKSSDYEETATNNGFPEDDKTTTLPQQKPEGFEYDNNDADTAQKQAADETEPAESSKIIFSDHVQVPVRKLDNLLNLVGELVIERDRIIGLNSEKISTSEYSRLNRISSDLQYSVMDVRLVQVSFLFNKFHRIVRDTASLENKSVSLTLKGTETEIDRNILQIISDSLIHLIRNAIGHGIESMADRKNVGKPEEGNLTLKAISESDAVIIEVSDDGRGIDTNKIREKAIRNGFLTEAEAKNFNDNDIVLMIFEPGFSTADDVSELSGRGVGMDVVKKALDSIGGAVSVTTQKGIGTTFSLRLPASMAVKGTLLFELQHITYAIPLSYTDAVISIRKKEIYKVSNGLVTSHLGKTIPLVFLQDIFELPYANLINESKVLHKTYDSTPADKALNIVIVSYNTRIMGIVVDKLLQQKEIVEKPLMKPFDNVKLINGVTILGNGHVCPVLNVATLFNLIFIRNYTTKKN
ncbi:chemotaxis protein CheA [Fulvivirga kasyanovii]|uniref:Chemotaxis protein CheA n=1 Tax=Fulvivirga kasyanovii TaxID=396812 RepID=A0ABW9RW51_9BACT|nr:chemotaxis protein CheA [Fulvivirga kasyanovii]MTI28462.1 chemotaxis protein CheA [Fulvivirga kasyanovii]